MGTLSSSSSYVAIVINLVAFSTASLRDPGTCYVQSTNISCKGSIPETIPAGINNVVLTDVPRNLSETDFSHPSWGSLVETLHISFSNSTFDREIHIAANTFFSLRSLKVIGLHGPEIKQISTNACRGLKLTEVDLSGCTRIGWKEVVNFLSCNESKHSVNFLNLNDIAVANGMVLEVNDIFFTTLSSLRSLRTLSFRGCALSFNLHDFNDNITVTNIDMSHLVAVFVGRNANFPEPKMYPFLETINGSFTQMFMGKYGFYNEKSTFIDCDDLSFIFALKESYFNNIRYMKPEMPVPLVFSNVYYDISRCEVKTKVMHFRGNMITYLDIHVIWPDKKTLLDVDFSFNELEYISPLFLGQQTGIETVELGNNRLHLMELTKDFSELFVSFSNLTYVGLAHNRLSNIPYDTFTKNLKLRHLDLSGNRFDRVDFRLNHLQKLLALDLSGNNIKSLGQKSLMGMHTLLITMSSKPNYQLLMHENPFECTCNNKQFTRWLLNSLRKYTKDEVWCTVDGNRVSVDEDILMRVKLVCNRKWIILATVMIALILLVGTCFLILWSVRKNRRARKRQFLEDYKMRTTTEKWLAMLAFSSSDGDVVSRYIYKPLEYAAKTMCDVDFDVICNNEIHFLPGIPITEEIIRCISESYVLVVAVSRAFCKSKWCCREVEEAFKDKKAVLAIFIEHIEDNLIPQYLKTIFERNTAAKLVECNGSYELRPSAENICKSILLLAQTSAEESSCRYQCTSKVLCPVSCRI